AIVGTRRATMAGKEIAKKLAYGLSKNDLVIVSGLAIGIDTSAHEGAVEAGGKTIAVLACGLDRIYPAQNSSLSKEILELGGAIVSEYPAGTDSFPKNFIERNRIISGMSLGVIVVEAPEKSGALATVRFAVEQNRDVFVVPGQIDHPNYVGSHALIKSGAALVTDVKDVLDSLNIAVKPEGKNPETKSADLNEVESKLVAALTESGRPLNVDKISQLMQIDSSEASRLLTFLLIKGIIKESGGKYYLCS
ncbi:MAG: DNA-processing protein DprA, partial [Patescibacteria group bacterium]